MTGYGPLWPVDGPPPLPAVYGLLQAAAAPPVRINPGADLVDAGQQPRWINGIEVWPYPPDTAFGWDSCSSGSPNAEKDFGTDDFENQIFGSLTFYLPETCQASHVPDYDRFRARAVAAFTAVEGEAIEREFLAGALAATNPHLADGRGVFPNLDAATTVIRGISLLENVIAASGRQGLIHMSPAAATIGGYLMGIFPDTRLGVLRTINGTVVIPGQGYAAGATPESHAAPSGDEEWIYASGPVDVRRGEVEVLPSTVAEALDRSVGATNDKSNTITYRAERDYVVSWDTAVQGAVLVDLCLSSCP